MRVPCLLAATVMVVLGTNAFAQSAETTFRDVFKSVCFDTDWIDGRESTDMEFIGFASFVSEGPRRSYRLGNLMLASFLDSDDSYDGIPVCTLTTKSVDPSTTRQAMIEWPEAGRPHEDEVVSAKRLTTWNVKYRRHRGVVLMEEETTSSGTTIRLSLLGEN